MGYLLYNFRNKLYDSHIGDVVAVTLFAGGLPLTGFPLNMKQINEYWFVINYKL
jgi:hypothetical protein